MEATPFDCQQDHEVEESATLLCSDESQLPQEEPMIIKPIPHVHHQSSNMPSIVPRPSLTASLQQPPTNMWCYSQGPLPTVSSSNMFGFQMMQVPMMQYLPSAVPPTVAFQGHYGAEQGGATSTTRKRKTPPSHPCCEVYNVHLSSGLRGGCKHAKNCLVRAQIAEKKKRTAATNKRARRCRVELSE
jgi:hypothetical protein